MAVTLFEVTKIKRMDAFRVMVEITFVSTRKSVFAEAQEISLLTSCSSELNQFL